MRTLMFLALCLFCTACHRQPVALEKPGKTSMLSEKYPEEIKEILDGKQKKQIAEDQAKILNGAEDASRDGHEIAEVLLKKAVSIGRRLPEQPRPKGPFYKIEWANGQWTAVPD